MTHQHLCLQGLHSLQGNAHDDDDGGTTDSQVLNAGHQVTANIIGIGSLAIGGTSVIIVVGVALETVKALEAQMLMRHYKGFLE